MINVWHLSKGSQHRQGSPLVPFENFDFFERLSMDSDFLKRRKEQFRTFGNGIERNRKRLSTRFYNKLHKVLKTNVSINKGFLQQRNKQHVGKRINTNRITFRERKKHRKTQTFPLRVEVFPGFQRFL